MDRHYVYLIACKGETKTYVKIGLTSSLEGLGGGEAPAPSSSADESPAEDAEAEEEAPAEAPEEEAKPEENTSDE